MIDSTKVVIASKDLEQIANAIIQTPSGLSSGEIALIAAAIGACSAILAQLIIFILNHRKDISKLKKELVAEERRISYLLSQYYKELVLHLVLKHYWYRLSKIYKSNKKRSKKYHERHSVSNLDSYNTMSKIKVTTSEYFKTVTLFTNLTKSNEIINETLEKIKEFKTQMPSQFPECTSYEELIKATENEKSKLNNNLLFYSDCFNSINKEMILKM